MNTISKTTNTARKMTVDEIISLPQGAVVWYEEHFSYDCSEDGVCGIPFYFLYPIMVATDEDEDFMMIGARYGCEPECWRANTLQDMNIWNRKPSRNQLQGLNHWDIDDIPKETLQKMSDEQGNGLTALKKRILWEYGSINAFANRIGLNASTLANRLTGKTEFKYHEIVSIMEALGVGSAQIQRYFFSD